MSQSKKYQSKLCVYCRNAPSTTADHVFPREMFQVHQRSNLPKAPSCIKCNNEKSKIEHYLLSVLPFGATHTHAVPALAIDTKKRLTKNAKLHKRLQSDSNYSYIRVNEYKMERHLTLNFDASALHKFAGLAALDLMWHHWNQYVPPDFDYVAFTPSKAGIEYIISLFNLETSHRIQNTLAGDTIQYKGVASEIDNGLSIWAIQLLGGMTIATEGHREIFKNSFVAVITGSATVISGIDLL